MFIYALGRGTQPTDQHTLDEIVARLDESAGKPSLLIAGIIESPAFQRLGDARDAEGNRPDRTSSSK